MVTLKLSQESINSKQSLIPEASSARLLLLFQGICEIKFLL